MIAKVTADLQTKEKRAVKGVWMAIAWPKPSPPSTPSLGLPARVRGGDRRPGPRWIDKTLFFYVSGGEQGKTGG